MLYVLRYHVPAASTDWLVYVVGGGFSLVGLVMLVLGLRMLAVARLPETIVEVDRMPVAAGAPFRVTVRQPGPVRLESLRLSLVAEQTTARFVWRRGRRERDRDRRLVHQQNVIDVTAVTVAQGEEFTRQVDATVPPHVTLADIEGDTAVVWRLEVWGRVRHGIDFGHPFATSQVVQLEEPHGVTSCFEARPRPYRGGVHGFRYQVTDVARAVDFYTRQLGFTLKHER